MLLTCGSTQSLDLRKAPPTSKNTTHKVGGRRLIRLLDSRLAYYTALRVCCYNNPEAEIKIGAAPESPHSENKERLDARQR